MPLPSSNSNDEAAIKQREIAAAEALTAQKLGGRSSTIVAGYRIAADEQQAAVARRPKPTAKDPYS